MDDVFILQFVHQKGLSKRFLLLLPSHSTEVNLFKYVYLSILFRYDTVYYAKGTLSEFLFEFELCKTISH